MIVKKHYLLYLIVNLSKSLQKSLWNYIMGAILYEDKLEFIELFSLIQF